jgi:hypothetical protein
MGTDSGVSWVGYAPIESKSPRKPAATVTFKVYSDESGDLEGGFEIDPDGVFGGVERSDPERIAAFLRLSEIVRDEADHWVDIYSGERRD